MTAGLPRELIDEIKKAVLEGDANASMGIAGKALASGIPASTVLEQGFVPALKNMGDLFEKGDIFLPELMLAGDAMKGAMKILGPALKAAGGKQGSRPRIVLGTVEGDIHEIGKNIVGIMLETAGYEVLDLGMEVTADRFIQAAKESGAAIIGASALLTTTMERQREIVSKVRSEGLKVFVIVGGAPVTQEWATSIGADGYAEDAKDVVALVRGLLDGDSGRCKA